MLCLVASAEGIKEWTCGGSFGEFGPQVALYMNETFISGYENIVFIDSPTDTLYIWFLTKPEV